MLTALTVKNVSYHSNLKRFLNMLRGNRIITEINSASGVALRHITYINRNGNVNYAKLSAAIGDAQNILCPEGTALPDGYSRFENDEFRSRLSINLGVYILFGLKKVRPDLPVGLYDPKGNRTESVEELSRYNDNLVVVSDNLTGYNEVREKIIGETGAVISVTNNRQRLSGCRLVIAPDAVSEPLPLLGNTIILSGVQPKVCLPGVCYYDYSLRMPNTFASLKPSELSAEYFSGALYSCARQYELGWIVPTSCFNFTFSQTPASLCEYLASD